MHRPTSAEIKGVSIVDLIMALVAGDRSRKGNVLGASQWM
ncbi:hypothetical protein CKA32_002744 [Geitlerinema sp. FC II]|nr:hypothetical protein CKA32_002744 [Geitlerinema sp. FC II]